MIYRIAPLLLWYGATLLAQSKPEWSSCTVIAKMPADAKWIEPLNDRQRFELRQCRGDKIIVTGYERAKATPSLVFDTGDGYPRFLAHSENVLVLQSLGGASDHVYVFTFQSGQPVIALSTATKDLIQVRQSEAEVVVTVPPTAYPGPDGKFPATPSPKKYSFRLHAE